MNQRFKKGAASWMKKDEKLVRKEAVKICDIPDTAELKWDKNSDRVLEVFISNFILL